MKGNSKFSEAEVVEIRRALADLRLADRKEQKQMCRKLQRDYEFLISDFTQSNNDFTIRDFDCLIESGKIEIRSKKICSIQPVQ